MRKARTVIFTSPGGIFSHKTCSTFLTRFTAGRGSIMAWRALALRCLADGSEVVLGVGAWRIAPDGRDLERPRGGCGADAGRSLLALLRRLSALRSFEAAGARRDA